MKRVLGILLVASFLMTPSVALAQDVEFPEGSVNELDQFAVPVEDEAQADELCAAFQTSETAYPGEESVVFDVPDDTDSDVTCVRVPEATNASEGIEDPDAATAAEEEDDDDFDAAIPLAAAGGLVLLGLAWSLLREK